MIKVIIILFIISMSMSSCIRENYDLCPDYGKYKVLFLDKNDAKSTADYHVFITEKISQITFNSTQHKYIRLADTTLLKSDKVLKLFPGDYNFVALLSANQMICLNKKIQIKNNSPYLYADTIKSVIKRSYNNVILRFSLANSLIQTKCIIDSVFKERYKISRVVLSSPDDSDIYLDLSSGLCNYSQLVSDYYQEAVYNILTDVFNNYCVPIIKSNYLTFKVSIEDNEQKTDNTLFCRIFLNTDISQGKVYQFRFNVTPYAIQYINTSISDWDEKTNNISIPLN